MLIRDSGIDFVLHSRDQRLTTLVEVKSKPNTSSSWAAQLRRNRLAHGNPSPHGDFLLLVTPDKVYLWQGVDAGPDRLDPSFEVDARPLFAPYFQGTGVSASAASPQAFELVVASWLTDLVREAAPRERLAAEQSWLVKSGLLDAVAGGQIEYATAA
jgi:hypothetical protein